MFTLRSIPVCSHFFFLNTPSTTEIYTLSLHDALPILKKPPGFPPTAAFWIEVWSASLPSEVRMMPSAECPEVLRKYAFSVAGMAMIASQKPRRRSEEHTSELQSRGYLVCRLLLEKKKQ